MNSNSNDFWLLLLSGITAILYAVKNYDDMKETRKGVRFRKLLYGMFGSALTTWTMFELLYYFGLPERLCLAIGGACGYLGAEVVSRLIIGFIENKINRST